MRAVLVPFAVVASVGCAHLQDYESVQAGPRAKINFSSPFLEDRFMSFNRLDLFVYEADERCSFTSKGTIPVSVRGNEVSTYVPATRRAYSIVRQLRSESLSWRNLNATLDFRLCQRMALNTPSSTLTIPRRFA